MPVRHSAPSAGMNRSAMLRTVAGLSSCVGMPPARAKRPVNGVRPVANSEAFDNAAPSPLLSNHPVKHKPLA